MRFSNHFLDEIRDRVPISAVIGRRVSWDRKKTNAPKGDYWACCPFHGEKTPSFHCEDRKGRYHCFGCGVSGDHFRFLTDLDGMSFPEAVEQIANLAGVPMPKPDPAEAKREELRTTLLDVMELATLFFQEQLQSAAGAKARAYLRDRGLSGRTIETFRLGYAPESRNALKEYLAGKGIPKDQIEACGLVVHGPDIPVSYDRFRDRIMFPILSSRERVIAFGGRAMAPDAMAKYLNSNDTELFHKGNVLYNFARARRALGGADGASTVIAVEGYMDVIALHQAGIENAVAPLGTALTENQLELLWKMTPVPTLCFDGDGAGLRAANRAADLALPHIRPGRSVAFALLPDGKDPDDLVREDGRAPFDKVLLEAKPLAEMIWQRESATGGFETPEKRAELEAKLRQTVSVIQDESVRRHYQQVMREKLNAFFAPARQSNWNGQQRGGGKGRYQQNNQRHAGGGRDLSGNLARSALVRGTEELPALREAVMVMTVINHPQLLTEEYDSVSAVKFENRDLQKLWPLLLSQMSAVPPAELSRESLTERLESQGFGNVLTLLNQQVRNARLWTATPQAAFEDAREAFTQALALDKRARALKRQIAELEREIATAVEEGDEESFGPLMSTLREVKLEVSRLENQEAIIDGFGVMSGRVKGAVPG
ncbi:DNA primase [Rhizobium sp. L1K21]|uniref:DNA primase n=1 Tax=Rhizobium sp. L1K21 TaxID=2954933 RepID=UPI002093C8B7|nr:DNA primase [Rhizobium sp. L1K21]MCO6185516.1 DNA primase [Rhizobium sp. L1K21]